MADTKYMQTVAKKWEESQLAPRTIQTYMTSLKTLAEGPFKSASFIKDPVDIMTRINKYDSLNTRRTMLSAVIALGRINKTYGKIVKAYLPSNDELRVAINKEREERAGAKTEREETNWMSWNDVITKRDELINDVKRLPERAFTHPADWTKATRMMVLSLYTMLPPRRNKDYSEMVMVYTDAEMPKDKNYIVFDKDGTPTKFIFNVYKTAGKYGSQTIMIPEDLAAIIRIYYEHRKNIVGDRFLLNSDMNPLHPVNGLTRILNAALGGNVGSSMLRHIFLSDSGDIGKMTETAKAMAHSVGMQTQYMRK